MSQAKVDYYKEQKRNRRKIMRRQKIENALLKVCGVVLSAAIVVWIGYSAVKLTGNNKSADTTAETTNYVLDTSALDSYMSGLEEE